MLKQPELATVAAVATPGLEGQGEEVVAIGENRGLRGTYPTGAFVVCGMGAVCSAEGQGANGLHSVLCRTKIQHDFRLPGVNGSADHGITATSTCATCGMLFSSRGWQPRFRGTKGRGRLT